MSCKHNMRGHRHRKRRERPKSGKIRRFENRPIGVDDRQLGVAVGGRAAMAGNVLEYRQNAAVRQALGDRAGNSGDLVGLGAIGPIADHRIGASHRHVRDRQAIDIDAQCWRGRRR